LKKIKLYIYFLILLSISLIHAQRKEIKGQLIANDDVEGIHILNKTASKYAISNEDGSFEIIAKAADTLFISGLKYEAKEIVVTQLIADIGEFSVLLTEKINELDQVILGQLLTGSLESDLENSDVKTEVNFYDLGIPGNTNLPMTQNERKLHDADGGPDILSMSGGPFGGGVGLNLHKLLNRISGRTKKLREIVELDDKNKCINRLRNNYASIIFENDSLAERHKNEYFMFCLEDESVKALCKKDNDLESIAFLQEKLKAYKINRESATKD
jgi:hypothetical protein